MATRLLQLHAPFVLKHHSTVQQDCQAGHRPSRSQLPVHCTPRQSLGRRRAVRPLGALAEPVDSHTHDHEHHLTPEEKEQKKAELLEQYKQLPKQADPQEAIHKEMKLATWLLKQDEFSKALLHLDRIMAHSEYKSMEFGDAALEKAKALQKLGRKDEARALYEALLGHPFPRIKTKARTVIYGSDGVDSSDRFGADWYLRQFLKAGSGWNTWYDSKKRVESKEEQVVMAGIPWALLLMGPILIFFVVFQFSNNS